MPTPLNDNLTMKKILYAMSAVALMASCSSGEYEDWADPQSTPQEDAKTVMLSLAPASAIAFADIATDSVQLFVPTVTAENGVVNTYNVVLHSDEGDATQTVTAGENGMVATNELQTAYYTLVGRRPVARTLNLDVVAYTAVKGMSIKNVGNTHATLTANAPVIAAKYYITGGINGWDNTNTAYPVENGGGDVYDDPIFKATLTAEQVGEGFEFKLTPVDGVGGDWSGCITAAVDGSEGKLADSNAGGNLSITPVDGAVLYNLEFDLLNQTWSVKPVSFSLYIYEIGNSQGWSTNMPLSSPNYDGNYNGFAYLDGEFKFKPNADNWDGDWGQVPDATYGTLTEDGEQNCWYNDDAGYYAMNVNLTNMTYSLTKINTIGIIGNGGDWDNDIAMTYNQADGTWDVTADLKAGEFKFRANNGWDFNWGGTTDNLTQGGANCKLDADGNYTVKLKALCDGQASYTIVKN